MGRFENWHQSWCVLDHEGALDALPAELERLGSTRCLFLLSRTLDRSGTLADEVAKLIGDRMVERSAQIVPHVPRESALHVAGLLREWSVDTVVTLGGGSVVDTAKAARLALRYECDEPADFDRLRRDPGHGDPRPGGPGPKVSLVSLPTTLAGAEFTSIAGVVDSERKVKDLYSYDELVPDLIILDPRLATETPTRLWHTSGVKLVSDAIEQAYGRQRHSVVSTLALDGARRIVAGLTARHDGGGVLDCFRGAWFSMFGVLGAQTFPGIGAALRHQLGAHAGASHGAVAAVLLPHVLRFNLPACPDVVPEIGAVVGAAASADATVAAVESWLERLDVPRRLRELGVSRDMLPAVARSSVGSFAGRNNPREATADELLDLLLAAH